MTASRRLFLQDINTEDGRLAWSTAGSPESLAQRCDRRPRPDLRNGLYIADIDPQFEGCGRNCSGWPRIVAQPYLDLFAFRLRKTAVMWKELVG